MQVGRILIVLLQLSCFYPSSLLSLPIFLTLPSLYLFTLLALRPFHQQDGACCNADCTIKADSTVCRPETQCKMSVACSSGACAVRGSNQGTENKLAGEVEKKEQLAVTYYSARRGVLPPSSSRSLLHSPACPSCSMYGSHGPVVLLSPGFSLARALGWKQYR